MATKDSAAGRNSDQFSGLHRSTTNRVIAGVCGGLGEYFSIDPTIIRIIFILITIFHGSGILVYIVLWLIMPSESRIVGSQDTIRQNVDELKERAQTFAHDIRSRSQTRGQSILPLVLIAIGVLFLLNNFGAFDVFNWHDFWPVILIIFGLFILYR